MFTKHQRKEWGKGIPNYENKDLMTPYDLYDFGLDMIANFAKKENYNLLDANKSMDSYPSLVLQKNNQLYFVLVEVDVQFKQPKINPIRKFVMIKHSKKFNAIPLYASCSFGSTDHERFDKQLALIGDSYYLNFTGFEELKLDDDVNNFEMIKIKMLDNLIDVFSSKKYALLNDILDKDCIIYFDNQNSNIVDLKYVFKSYLEQYKDKKVFSTLCRLKIKDNFKPLLFIGYEDDNGKNHVELDIEVNKDNLITKMKFISCNYNDLIID